MSWDKVKMGFYCDRCGASIWMDVRQKKYIGPNGEGTKMGDPYLGVHHHAFLEEDKRGHGLHYCYECEPVVINVLLALKETK